jgi:hypothetical protein
MSARGPLPTANPRRRNAPTIPTTNLPAGGYTGEIPDCPYDLAAAGTAWWEWAWRTPQASAWDPGSLYALARRAQLEDDVAALGFTDEFDLTDLLAGADIEAVHRVEFALATLKRSATGKLAIEKEMSALDDKFGLTAKGLAALRWTIVPDVGQAIAPTAPTAPTAPPPSRPPASRGHLRAVDPALVA